MQAELVVLSPEQLEERRRWGLDRRDEMWDGVLHIVPSPLIKHQRMLGELIGFLLPLFRMSGRGTLLSEISTFASSNNYRIPDLTFISAARESLLAEDGVRGGGPDAVLEMRSPGDETYKKLPFFAAIGTREVIVIDRDSKRPELFRLVGSQLVAVQADRDGWLASETMAVRFRVEPGSPARLGVEDVLDPSVRTMF